MAQILTLYDKMIRYNLQNHQVTVLKPAKPCCALLFYVLALLTAVPAGEVGYLVSSGPFPLRGWILVQTDPAPATDKALILFFIADGDQVSVSVPTVGPCIVPALPMTVMFKGLCSQAWHLPTQRREEEQQGDKNADFLHCVFHRRVSIYLQLHAHFTVSGNM